MNPLQSLIYWKMFWFKLLLSTLVITSLAVGAGLAGVDNWSSLPPFEKFLIINAILGVIGTNILSLLDKTYAGLSDANPVLPPNPVITQQPVVTNSQTLNKV